MLHSMRAGTAGAHCMFRKSCSKVVKSPDASQASTARTSGLLCVYFGSILVVFKNRVLLPVLPIYHIQSTIPAQFKKSSCVTLRTFQSSSCALCYSLSCRCPLLLSCSVLPPSPDCLAAFFTLTNSFPNFHKKALCILELFDNTNLYVKYKET